MCVSSSAEGKTPRASQSTSERTTSTEKNKNSAAQTQHRKWTTVTGYSQVLSSLVQVMSAYSTVNVLNGGKCLKLLQRPDSIVCNFIYISLHLTMRVTPSPSCLSPETLEQPPGKSRPQSKRSNTVTLTLV